MYASGNIYFWGAESGLIQAWRPTTATGMLNAVWLTGEETVATIGANGQISLWGVTSGRIFSSSWRILPRCEVCSGSEPIRGRQIPFFSGTQTARFKNLRGMARGYESERWADAPTAIAHFSNTGLLLSVNQDGTVEIIQLESEAV